MSKKKKVVAPPEPLKVEIVTGVIITKTLRIELKDAKLVWIGNG
jgi:hypothetical protein